MKIHNYLLVLLIALLFLALVGFGIYQSTVSKSTLDKYRVTPHGQKEGEQGGTMQVTTNFPFAAPSGAQAKESFPLEITEPLMNATVVKKTLTIKGKTASNAAVFINEDEVKADAKGNFTDTYVLEEGDTDFVILANDAEGNYAEKDLTVTYEAPVSE